MTDRDLPLSLEQAVVSPSTGLDSELRQFVGRVLTGYESAHRRMADLCETMAKRAESAERVASEALESRIRLAVELEDAISQRHQRDLAAQMAQQRSAAFAEVTRDVRAIAPLALKRLLGIPITGNDSHGLKDLLGTLSGDQVEKLMSDGTLTLSMGQRQLLMNVLTSFAADEKKLEAKPEAAE